MGEIHEEYSKLVNSIKKLELTTVAAALNDDKKFNQNAESNKYLFKLLMYLSHCADRCNKEKLSKELEVFTVANNICKNLISVFDKNRFYLAIYVITNYILKKQYYQEAKIITSYLFPGKILEVNDKYESSKYHEVAALWHTELVKKLESLVANVKKDVSKIDKEVYTVFLFYMEILNFASDNSSYILKVVGDHIQKLSVVPLNIIFPFFFKVFEYFSNYLKNLKNNFIEVFNSVLLIFASAFFKRTDAINNTKILKYFRQCDELFLQISKTSTECNDCYMFYRNFSLNLLETDFMTKGVGERYKKCSEILEILLRKYGSTDCLQETIAAISLSFETLFPNLENLVCNQLKNTNISYEDILMFGTFIKQVYAIMKNRSFSKTYLCNKCSASTQCSIKKDIYGASVAMSKYLNLIARFDNNHVDEKIFMTAKNLIDELVISFYALDKSGCKYSSPLWDLCGRIIFNIGLISEAKFPKELEELYEIFCKQIILRDGLDSKMSSFGLQNPVGAALSRLTIINFNQEKFRNALTYAAYNALLSNNESRKKKACDIWTNIKLKSTDSEEIQELTMIKCLKSDYKVIENLGINISLDNYDLSDLCFRELGSLYQAKGNLIISIEKVLEELELMNDNLGYAKGVLLLCLHSLKLSKRKYITEYIIKALENLKKIPKSHSNHCLIANLNFFNIIEKLYARSQAISKQSEEANFTVKAFKTLRGKKLYEETENENDVVPTYGGISIDEDNKLSKELKSVISMWETCVEKSVSSVANSWESKFTLETVVICGEYCRLYKFHHLEKTTWNIVFKLATELKDYATCVYVTSRSLSLKYINHEWISNSTNYVNELQNSTKPHDIDVVTLFWLSLADFYLDCRKIAEAKILLEKVKAIPNYRILSNSKLTIYGNDIELRHFFLLNTHASQEDYFQLLVEIHYSLINLHDVITSDICRFINFRYQLFACEQIFEVMCNMIIPMNSILSHREVYSHLVHEMNIAQKLGMTLRIAQILKYLCFIDLLRGQIQDCETKLQDLEHILCLEYFPISKNTKTSNEKSNNKILSQHELRDVSVANPIDMSQNKASPELKKTFSNPSFMSHTNYCNCSICTNITYQYLTFSCNHIRAQLYSLLNFTIEAQGYFQGAMKIKSRIEDLDSDKVRRCKDYQWKRNHSNTVDGLMCLLDYTVFIIDFYPKNQEDALALIEEIINIADQNDLSKHWVSIYAKELYFQHFIYNVFNDQMSSIFVPDDIQITITNQSNGLCITPRQHIEKIAQNIRRKSPKALGIPVITIDTSDVENSSVAGNLSDSELNKNIEVENDKKTKKPRSVRRKILVDECEENGLSLDKAESVPIRRSTRSTKKLSSD